MATAPKKPRAKEVKAKPRAKKRPTPISQRAKPRAKVRKKGVLAPKNMPILAITVLFCAGIMAGAWLLNSAYNSHLETQALYHAEQLAAKQAQAQLKKTTQKTPAATKTPPVVTVPPKTAPPKIAPTAITASPKVALPPSAATRPIPSSVLAEPVHKVVFSPYTPAVGQPIMAIVIDDVGYKRQEGERVLALPGKLTVAVLPFTPQAHALASKAPFVGKEVMLHAPMQPKLLRHWGEGLSAAMPEQALRASFIAMINDIPNLMGINNHMGSELTENQQVMDWLMAELPARGLYFVDSRTSADSVAFKAAQQKGVPTYKRDIFLDHSRKIKDIHEQFDRLVHVAKHNGMALGIGHPYPETLQVLEERMPQLHALGIELVTVSELLNARASRLKLASAANTKAKKSQIALKN